MAKKLITQELVFKTADSLVHEGKDPSVITIQSQLGMGSFTTIQKYYKEWLEQKTKKASSQLHVPQELLSKRDQFFEEVWKYAAGLAQIAIESVQEKADRDIHQFKKELDEALMAVEQLEKSEIALKEELQEAKLKNLELEKKLSSLQSELRIHQEKSEKDRDLQKQVLLLQKNMDSLMKEFKKTNG